MLGEAQMLLEAVNLSPAYCRVRVNRVNVAAEHADSDARLVEFFTDIISQRGAELARRKINILYSFGQGELHEVNVMSLQSGNQCV
ncbi:hypothetical protein AWJ19_19630 [Paenibacillus sp. DMB5]|nr:hypothetical protein AWJ19_19630 [Paenibacillus sp. DMB5]